MKRSIVFIFAVIICFSQTSVSASSVGSMFGTLQTAQSGGQGNGNLGLGIGLTDNITSFLGSYTYGLSEYTDGRLKIALIDPDGGDIQIALGGDFKWQFWNLDPNTTHPFDFAIGGLFEYADFGAVSAFQVGGLLIASYPLKLSNNSVLTPYGRFNARLEAVSFDAPPGFTGDDSESSLEIGLNGGVKWQMTNTMSLFGEFQIDGNDGVFMGVDFNIM